MWKWNRGWIIIECVDLTVNYPFSRVAPLVWIIACLESLDHILGMMRFAFNYWTRTWLLLLSWSLDHGNYVVLDCRCIMFVVLVLCVKLYCVKLRHDQYRVVSCRVWTAYMSVWLTFCFMKRLSSSSTMWTHLGPSFNGRLRSYLFKL